MWGVRGVNFDDLWGLRGSTLVTFVKDFVTFGGQGGQFGDLWGVRGVNFADICEGFCDLWGVRGVNFGDLWG